MKAARRAGFRIDTQRGRDIGRAHPRPWIRAAVLVDRPGRRGRKARAKIARLAARYGLEARP